jgi:hypothetical protein
MPSCVLPRNGRNLAVSASKKTHPLLRSSPATPDFRVKN